MPSPPSKATEIHIQSVQTERVTVTILGTTPLICNRMSEKARRTLLVPPGRMTPAEKQSNQKHNPIEEFRASPYTLSDENAPTFIALMSSAFKGAMSTAALDMPGAKKAQIGRLVYVEDDYVPIYGEPQLFMSVTRSADMNRTPDIRTRAILPEWACQISVRFVTPMLKLPSILNLLAAAGLTAGVGDWRPEKGKGSFGQFTIVNETDARFIAIQALGRETQQRAMASPVSYDTETADLLSWYDDTTDKRGGRIAA